MPRCAHCKTKFTAKYFLQRYCMETDECMTAFTEFAKEKTQEANEKKWKAEKKVLKEKGLTHSDHIQLLQKVFNTFIRFRDKNEPCISCGTTKGVEYAAGHFYPTTYQYLRFNEDNVHKQCNKHCNMMKRGNLQEYRINLEAKIGFDRLQKLHNERHLKLELSIPEIKELIVLYKNKIKEFKK